MKKVLSEIHGFIYERAVVKGMKEIRGGYYDFSKAEVKCWVKITEKGVKTEFYICSKPSCDLKDHLYTTDSFKKLRKWLEEHKDEIK